MRSFVVAVVLGGAVAAGCGKQGPPQPPEPRGPLPPRGVEARQVGDVVEVRFTAPEPRGERPAQRPVTAELVRVAYNPGITVPADPQAFRIRGTIVARIQQDEALSPGDRLVLADRTLDDLSGGGDGWTLRYGVRVRDRRGRPSPLVVAPDVVAGAAPPVPTGLSAEATADGIRLAWHRGPEADGARFNVYRAVGQETMPERTLNPQPLTATDLLDSGVVVGRTYRYVVRSVAGERSPYRESASSREVVVVAEDRFAPARPGGLVAVQEGSAVRLFWNPNDERDLAGYRVWRREPTEDWRPIGADPVPEPQYLDRDVAPGRRLSYRVTAVDRANPPNESAPSEPVEVETVEDPIEPARPGP